MTSRTPVLVAIGRFFRTTAVKLSLVYLVVFSLVIIALVIYVANATSDILATELRESVDAEVRELQDHYETGGVLQVVNLVDTRSRQPGAGLYLITDPAGEPLLGNISDLPAGVVVGNEDVVRTVPYTRLDQVRFQSEQHIALVRVFSLANGFRVLIGRDIGEREKFRDLFAEALKAIVVVTVLLGLVTWWFVSRTVLKRIDQVAHTSNGIVSGDLTGRLPVTGSNDEFDRLAVGLNHMFDRIADLMRGLKEVSDNIAHDLKTPLTRLRNRAEEALSETAEPQDMRRALEGVITDCDGLIRTFDALLTIARVEAGNQSGALVPQDLSAILSDVIELYEPLAEEAGVAFEFLPMDGAIVLGNRELLAQALANMVDNAIKYGRPTDRSPIVHLSVAADGDGIIVSVADNGPGIPDADRDRVMDRFVRLEASRQSPGLGLGLSLVAAIARQHGSALQLLDANPGLLARMRLKRA